MLAEDLLREAKLDEARKTLQDAVRSDPANAKYRVFLFQLLAVMGEWDRALNQLNVAAEMDPSTLAMAQMYREALNCEKLRQAVFAGERSPLIFGEPEQWIALMLESLRLGTQGQLAAAAQLRDEAFEAAPTTSGRLRTQADPEQDVEFEWIADADMRFGPLLEAVVNGRYYWVPFHRIRKITIEPPADLRDTVWMPAYFTWANGGEMVGVIPTRYPGSETSDDGRIRLARRTEWQEREDGSAIGRGQRMLTADGEEFSLMDIREISLDVVAAETSGPAEDDAPSSSSQSAAEGAAGGDA